MTKKKEDVVVKKKNTVDIVAMIGHDVVLIKRTKEPFKNKLVFPGGRIEETDNSPEEACARESFEEINLPVDPDRLIYITTLEGQDPRPEVGPSTVFLYNLTDPELIAGLTPGSDAREIIRKNIFEIEEDEMGFQHFEAIKILKRKIKP